MPKRTNTERASRILSLPGGSGAPVPPPDRGPILYADDVQREFYPRHTVQWVKDHVAPAEKFKVGRLTAWYRDDVLAFHRGFLDRRSA